MAKAAAALVLSTLSLTQDVQAQCKEPKRPAAGTTLRMVVTLDVTVLDSEAVVVPHAVVRFQDAAPPPAERDEGRVLGSTGADGRLAAQVTHEWHDYFSETRRPDSGAFDIVIYAPNGEQVVRHFVVECLTRAEDGYQAQVRVLLARRRDSIIIY